MITEQTQRVVVNPSLASQLPPRNATRLESLPKVNDELVYGVYV